MRLPRVRFKVRHLMIAGALVAIAIAAEQTRLRSMQYWAMADFHATRERHHQRLVQLLESSTRGEPPGPAHEVHVQDLHTSQAQAVFHASQRQKYEYAVWRPWERVVREPFQP